MRAPARPPAPHPAGTRSPSSASPPRSPSCWLAAAAKRKRSEEARHNGAGDADLVDRPDRRRRESARAAGPEFHTAHPNVTINVSSGAPTTDDLLQKLSAGFASGKYPDISYAYGSWAGRAGGSRARPRTSPKGRGPGGGLVGAPGGRARRRRRRGRQVIGFPALVDNLALIYNTKLFDEAGVAYPTDDWTWDDFRAAAKKLTDPATEHLRLRRTRSAAARTPPGTCGRCCGRRGGADPRDAARSRRSTPTPGVDGLELLRAMAVDDKSHVPRPDRREVRPAVRRRPDRHDHLRAVGALRPRAGQDAVRRRAPARHQRRPPDRLRPRPLGCCSTTTTPTGPAASRDFIKWLTSKEIDAQWNLAIGQPAAALLGAGHARVRHLRQGVPGRAEVLRQPGQRQAGPADPRRLRGDVALRR